MMPLGRKIFISTYVTNERNIIIIHDIVDCLKFSLKLLKNALHKEVSDSFNCFIKAYSIEV
jgi:hypothetical protein